VTRQEKYRWLYRARNSQVEEEQLSREMRELELSYMLPSITIDDIPHGSGGERDLSDFAAKWDALYDSLREAYDRRRRYHWEIHEAIESSDLTEAQRAVLRYFFLMGKTIEQIAVLMQYTSRHVLRLRARAVDRLVIPAQKMS